jgi:hypothetical protein
MLGEPSLGGDRRSHGVTCAAKRHEERVTLGIDLLPASFRERRTKNSLVLREDGTVPIPELLQQPRRTLDIREEEGDGAAGKLGHGLSIARSRLPCQPEFESTIAHCAAPVMLAVWPRLAK